MPEKGLIGRTIGNFRIGRMIGQGGMGAVYEATDIGLQRQVALKVMHTHLASQPTFQGRFLQEARTAARLDHPNIVRVLSFDKLEGELLLVMELATGGNLRSYVKRLNDNGRYVDYPEAIEIVKQLADALHYAHTQNMIHMDIKPDNVVLKPESGTKKLLNYRPILTDFGIARLTTSGDSAITDQPLGTYAYMSPEQCNAETVDARTDIYSLGIMLYELAVGQLPYQPKTIAEAARMHGQEPLPLPSALRRGFPEDLEAVIVRSLHKKQERRFQSAEELLQSLLALHHATPSDPEIASAPAVTAAVAASAVIAEVLEVEATDRVTQMLAEPLPLQLPVDALVPDVSALTQADCLVFFNAENPDEAPNVIPLSADTMTIGRAQDQAIVLSSQSISRRHAQIQRKPNGKYYLSDVGSSNGVYVGSGRLKVNAPVILEPGNIAVLGKYWMLLEPKHIASEALLVESVNDVAPANDSAMLIIAPVILPQPAAEPLIDPEIAPEQDELRDIEFPWPEDFTVEESQPTPVSAKTGQQAPVESGAQLPLPPAAPPLAAPPLAAPSATDGFATQSMSDPLPARMPDYTPVPLSGDQIRYGRLIFFSERHPMQVVALNQPRITIGRAVDQIVRLEGTVVSRRHAQIDRLPDGRLVIIDLDSENGVRVGSQRIAPNTAFELRADAVIRLGDYWVKYERSRGEIGVAGLGDGGDLDQQVTVAMVRPLPPEMPPYSSPPMNAEQRSKDRLIFYSEDHPLQIVLLEKQVLRIGRAVDQDVRLQGKRVSRRHAQIEVQPDGNLYVTAFVSPNPVWIDDTQLVRDTPVVWQPSEILRIGNYWVKFERGTHQFDPFAGAQYLQDDRGLIGKTIKTYRIDRFIGTNPVASVYKATDIRLDRPIALRILKPELASEEVVKQRFLQEARLLGRLDHPNIVHVLSFDNVDNEVFMVQELIEGGSLRQYLNQLNARNRYIEFPDVVTMSIQMADALHYAHQQNMLHRIIQPENVVLKPGATIGPLVTYHPILTDFGMAGLAETGEIFITEKADLAFSYMTPEQCLSRREDARSDIYELGTLLYEMTTGRPPFEPRSIAEAVRLHVHERPRLPSELRPNFPSELEKIILKALEKDPNNRYQSADELSRALQRVTMLLAGEGASMSSGGRYFSVLVDEHATNPIDISQLIPKQMPMATRYPVANVDAATDRLVIYSEEFPTRVIPLNKDIFTIGRGDDQDIQLDHKLVSRRHARLERASGEVYRIIDMGSKNGSYLGDYKLVNRVAEIWEPSETVRVGAYWLRIESAKLQAPPPARAAVNGAAKAAELPAVPAIKHPAPEHDKIGLVVSNPTVHVPPGSSVTMPLEVINKSDRVDHFKVDLRGLPPTWYTQPVEALYLLPQNRETTSITFHPPRSSSSSSGGHAFEVRVTARAQRINSVAQQGTLIIEPLHNYVVSLNPERIRRRGVCEVRITNTGNAHGTYTLLARDREQLLRFEMSGKQYTLPPGQTGYVPVRVSPRRRPLFGRPQPHPFEIVVQPDNEALQPQPQTGELIIYPRLSFWSVLGAALLLFLCAAITLLALLRVSQVAEFNQTATAVVQATGFVTNTAAVAMAQTATADADPDRDGLTTTEELALGTDPDSADTDRDGIPDGEEVRVWGTNPIQRDSDGDNISDGEEVNQLGTNPISNDTDGDTVPDNVDSFPGLLPTPTLTPFPTIEGQDGQICAGSPSPTRLRTGITAVVESGGVANRIRTEPGISVGQIVGFMPPDATFRVLEGPVCDTVDQIRWWKVDFNGIVGWSAEGEGEEYYLRPPEIPPGEGSSGGGAFTPAQIDTAALTVPAPEQLDSARIGVQLDINSSLWDRSLVQIEPAQVSWVKVQVSWAFTQPDDPAALNETILVRIREAKSRGHQVLVSIAKAPLWTRSLQGLDAPPDNLDDFAAFLNLLLERVGGDINAIEVWNEPNLRREWNTTALSFDGQGYMRLFDVAYNTIRAYSPNITIVTAGLAPTSTTNSSVNDRDYLSQMYAAGLGRYRDVAIGVHPYGWGNAPDARCCSPDSERGWDDQRQFFFLDTLADYRGITQAAAHDVQLWTTEFGWATWEDLPGSPPEGWMAYNSLLDQSTHTMRAFGLGQALAFMGPMFLWNLDFANADAVAAGSGMAAFSLFVGDESGGLRARQLYNVLVNR